MNLSKQIVLVSNGHACGFWKLCHPPVTWSQFRTLGDCRIQGQQSFPTCGDLSTCSLTKQGPRQLFRFMSQVRVFPWEASKYPCPNAPSAPRYLRWAPRVERPFKAAEIYSTKGPSSSYLPRLNMNCDLQKIIKPYLNFISLLFYIKNIMWFPQITHMFHLKYELNVPFIFHMFSGRIQLLRHSSDFQSGLGILWVYNVFIS